MLGDLDARGLNRAVSEDIRKVQRELGVTADGILGDETWAALRRTLDETERQVRDSLHFIPPAHVDPTFYTLEGNTIHSSEPGAVLVEVPSKPSRWHRLREWLDDRPAKRDKIDNEAFNSFIDELTGGDIYGDNTVG